MHEEIKMQNNESFTFSDLCPLDQGVILTHSKTVGHVKFDSENSQSCHNQLLNDMAEFQTSFHFWKKDFLFIRSGQSTFPESTGAQL